MLFHYNKTSFKIIIKGRQLNSVKMWKVNIDAHLPNHSCREKKFDLRLTVHGDLRLEF